MNNFYLYKDNVISKIKDNDEYKELLEWVEKYCRNEKNITLLIRKFSPKITVDKYVFKKVIENLIKYNEEMIEFYLKNSRFDKDDKEE